MKHRHADLMLQYANDAQETDKPWERWEVAYPNEDYRACGRDVDMDFDADNEYRRIEEDPYAHLKGKGDIQVVENYDMREPMMPHNPQWSLPEPEERFAFCLPPELYRVAPEEDPYAHLIEAKKRGKVIQLNTSTRLNTWVDMDDIEGFAYSPESYRIKPKTVKKWRWAYQLCTPEWHLSGYLSEATPDWTYYRRLDSTMIEVVV